MAHHVILPAGDVNRLEGFDIGVLGIINNGNKGNEGHHVGLEASLPKVFSRCRGGRPAALADHIRVLHVGVLVNKIRMVVNPPAVILVRLDLLHTVCSGVGAGAPLLLLRLLCLLHPFPAEVVLELHSPRKMDAMVVHLKLEEHLAAAKHCY